MTRVLVLCEHGTLNGGERSLLAVIDRLGEAGFELRVAAPPAGPLGEQLRVAGARWVPYELRAAHEKPRTQADRRLALRALLEEHAPDLVHANNLMASRLSGPVAASLGIPSLGHLRDIMHLSSAAVRDLNRHPRLLAVSDAVRRFYTAEGVGSCRMHVLYNGVDLQRFRPRPPTGYVARELHLASQAPLVLTVGQIGMRKGLDVLLEAARLVLAIWPSGHFLIAGARYSNKREAIEYASRVRDESARGPLAGHVHFLGVRDDIERLLNEATILVHAARQEPLGRVLLEAAAAGTPVVATDVGGTAEIFPPGSGAAELVPPDNPPALAAAMLRVLGSERLRERMSAAGRRIAESRFGVEQAAQALAEHYRDVVHAPLAPPDR